MNKMNKKNKEKEATELINCIVKRMINYLEEAEESDHKELSLSYSDDWLEMIKMGHLEKDEEEDLLFNYFEEDSDFYNAINKCLEKKTGKSFYWTRDDFDWVTFHEDDE